MKLVCIDAEYTGEHAFTTLVSLGLVGLDGRELYLTLNDYDCDQVTKWLKDNVLTLIDESQSVSSKEAYQRLREWLEEYGAGERIHLVSAGKGPDIILLNQLYHHACPERKYFHNLYCLPDYLNHTEHFDLNTLFRVVGFDSGRGRESFLGREVSPDRHNALYDARIVRDCLLELLANPLLKGFQGRADDAEPGNLQSMETYSATDRSIRVESGD